MSGTASTLWYFSDWLSDNELRLCSLAAKGLWIDLLAIAGSNKGRDFGFVLIAGRAPSAAELANIVRASAAEVETLLVELGKNRVFSRDRKGVIYCRRMVRAQKNRQNAKVGVEAKLLKQKKTGNSLVRPSGKGKGKGSSGNLFEESQEEQATRRRGARPRAPMPEDWKPTDRGRAYARQSGFADQSIDAMGRACCNHHRSKGTMIADFEATWRTWVDNEIKFSHRRNGGQNGESIRGSSSDAATKLVAGLRNGTLSIPPRPPRPADVLRGAGEAAPRLLPPE